MTAAERRARTRRRRTVAACAVLGAVALTIAVAQVTGWLQWRAFLRDVDGIHGVAGEQLTRPVSLRFRYAGRPYALHLEVPEAEVAESARVRTEHLFPLPDAVRGRYFKHLLLAASRSGAVRSLADELRIIRLRERLDSDQYLELITRAIQEIPYGVVSPEFLLPAEVLAGRSGVCSEKSVLLAALLTHEGYDTALIILDADGHVAVGVGSDGPGYLGSRFAFIETTAGMYVGQVKEAYRGVGPVPRAPQIVPVGSGRRYHASAEVDVIIRFLRQAQRDRNTFKPYVEYAESSSGMHAERYAQRAYDFTLAQDVAAFIIENADDRHRVYLDLTGSARDRMLAMAGRTWVAY
jgi:hypothetical protein